MKKFQAKMMVEMKKNRATETFSGKPSHWKSHVEDRVSGYEDNTEELIIQSKPVINI